jgi:shikimate dehydrogenase
MIRAAVLGSDVSKSRSPAIHNAAYKALGIEGEYGAKSVEAPQFTELVRRLRAEGYRYLNVTIPHKAAAADMADARGPEVLASGAANTLLFEKPDGPIRAENTDGAGLIAALHDLNVEIGPGENVVMVGAGGAAAGAVEALTRAGAHVHLVARRPAAAAAIQQRLPEPQGARVTVVAWTPDELAAAIGLADALVSAVPAAAWDDEVARDGLEAMSGNVAVLEMAYSAGESPLAQAVRAHTTRYADGLGMLVHQAARAIELALGKAPPVAPLFEAARQA